MIVHIEAGGRKRTVEVLREQRGYVATVDGREHQVDVSEIGGVWSLLVGTRSYEVVFIEGADGGTVVLVEGRPVLVAVEPARRSWGSGGRGIASGSAPTASGPHRVLAPMPGRIVKVLVTPGDPVQPNQGLVVVEAMKMENELRSPWAGTVSEVRVIEGATVEAGAVLVIVE